MSENTGATGANRFPIKLSKLQILVTEEDIKGTDILAMSDFFDGYVEELTRDIRASEDVDVITDIPVSDAVIIGEVFNQAKAVTKGMIQLIPDYDHLPKDIKEGLARGIYKVGESRQVDGNVRGVLVDADGIRVKDITFKKVHADSGTVEASRNIANQIQIKQITAKLDEIQAMQSYQIARDRDRDIYVPFFDARKYILLAQLEEDSEEDRKRYLRQASDLLSTTLTSIYRDFETSGESLVTLTGKRFFRNTKAINKMIGYVTTDLQLVHKMVGLNVRTLACLGDKNAIRVETGRYQKCMQDFFLKELPGCGCTLVGLIHENYPYTKENKNSWYNLALEAEKPLKELEQKGMEQIYLISVEDVDNGENGKEVLEMRKNTD